jgi:hypothetical protein
MTLEQYARERPAFRARIMEHKKSRQLAVGPNCTWLFEDRLTIQYQVQEMLRAERIYESEAIEEELAAYNPLIPDGANLKATMMIEYPDVEERKLALANLVGVEATVYVDVDDCGRVFAHADEDLPRSNDAKTSAVHFLRFELTEPMRVALKNGAVLKIGVDHPQYTHELVAPAEMTKSLASDLA